MKVTPTDADFAQACTMLWFRKWSDLKAKAREVAAERMIEAGQREIAEIVAKLNTEPRPGHAEWRKLQDRFTELLADGDALLRIAYPRTFKEGA